MQSLLPVFALLIGSAVAIYLACEFFVNGVEWVGRKLAVGQKATGTILAAAGTALPESVVTFVAVAFGASAAQKALGVGAALGGPLVLSTIAYGLVGLILLLTRQKLVKTLELCAEFKRLSVDQGWFLVIFAAKIGLGLITFAWKPWLGVLFLAAYALYVWSEMRASAAAEANEEDAALEPLRFAPKRADPPAWLAIVQTLIALVAIFAASRMFVSQLDVLGPRLGIKPQLLALLLSPIATELPETMNALIWVRQGKHRLALANISGSMMIQATVPTAFGLFFTPWRLDPPLVLAAGVTVAAVAALFVAFRRGMISRTLLAGMGLLYLVFVAGLFALHLRG
jgi:cation:H+ antiporter